MSTVLPAQGIPPAYNFLVALASSIRLLATPPSPLVLPGHSLPPSPALSALQENDPLQLDSEDELLPPSLFPMGTNYVRKPGAPRSRKELHKALTAPRETSPEFQGQVRIVDRDAGYVEEEEEQAEEQVEDEVERAIEDAKDATEVLEGGKQPTGAIPALPAQPEPNGAPADVPHSPPLTPSTSLPLPRRLSQPLFRSSPTPSSHSSPRHRLSNSPPPLPAETLPPALPREGSLLVMQVEVGEMREEVVEMELEDDEGEEEGEGVAEVSAEEARVARMQEVEVGVEGIEGEKFEEPMEEKVEERELDASGREEEIAAEVEQDEVVVSDEVVVLEESELRLEAQGVVVDEDIDEEKASGSLDQLECADPQLEADDVDEAAHPSADVDVPVKQAAEQDLASIPSIEPFAFPSFSLSPPPTLPHPSPPPSTPPPLHRPTTPPPLSATHIPSSEFDSTPALPQLRASTPTPLSSPAELPRYRFGELYQDSEPGSVEGFAREVVEFVREDIGGLGSGLREVPEMEVEEGGTARSEEERDRGVENEKLEEEEEEEPEEPVVEESVAGSVDEVGGGEEMEEEEGVLLSKAGLEEEEGVLLSKAGLEEEVAPEEEEVEREEEPLVEESVAGSLDEVVAEEDDTTAGLANVDEQPLDADPEVGVEKSTIEHDRAVEPLEPPQDDEETAATLPLDDHDDAEPEPTQSKPVEQTAFLPPDDNKPVELVEPEEPTANDEPDAAVESVLEEASEVEEERIALSKLAEAAVDEEVPDIEVVTTPAADDEVEEPASGRDALARTPEIVELAQDDVEDLIGESLVHGVVEEDIDEVVEQVDEEVVGQPMLGKEGDEVLDWAIDVAEDPVVVTEDAAAAATVEGSVVARLEDEHGPQVAVEGSPVPSSSKSRSEPKASHKRNRSFYVEILVPPASRRASTSRSPAKRGSSEAANAEPASSSTFKRAHTLPNDSDDEMESELTARRAPRLPSRVNKRTRRTVPDDEDESPNQPTASTSSFVRPLHKSTTPPVPSTSASSLPSANSRKARPPVLHPQSDEDEDEDEDSVVAPARSSPARPKGKGKAALEPEPEAADVEAESEVEEVEVEEEVEEDEVELEVDESERSVRASEEAFTPPSPPPRTSRKRAAPIPRSAPSRRLSRATTTTSATPTTASASFVSRRDRRLSSAVESSPAVETRARSSRERKTTGNWWDIKTALSSLASGKKRTAVVEEEPEEEEEEEEAPEEEEAEEVEEEEEEAADDSDDSETIPSSKAKKRRLDPDAQSTPVARKPRVRRAGPASLPKGRKLPGWAKDETWEDLSEVA